MFHVVKASWLKFLALVVPAGIVTGIFVAILFSVLISRMRDSLRCDGSTLESCSEPMSPLGGLLVFLLVGGVLLLVWSAVGLVGIAMAVQADRR
jgi:amino acid transporter